MKVEHYQFAPCLSKGITSDGILKDSSAKRKCKIELAEMWLVIKPNGPIQVQSRRLVLLGRMYFPVCTSNILEMVLFQTFKVYIK